ncbi:GH1 family beta-glucosidase [Herbidospora yilanensis]|uniref:GH1 family beta-glucosidase n=1 Tax=Herbidospora yilanensis TaxID=354426 RepID=UPI0007822EDD|nr:GH1 family beta-glucosidase [Herbidospora yilanensis]
MITFPEGFRWGAATASYQIEGAVTEGGRGPSIWDVFSHTPGKTADGHTGDVACDHYHRYPEDVAIMADLGLKAYRFSIAWPRVQPSGSGDPNPAGLDFYDRLVDALLTAGVEPVATLYHWDLPAALDWRDPATPERFAEYTAITHARLGDRVRTWTTLNEPWVSAFVGHGSGRHAPGVADPAAAFTVAHHLLTAHMLGVRALRAGGADEVSLTLNLTPMVGDPDVTTLPDGLANRLFLDPALKDGRYPDDVAAHIAKFTDLGDLPYEPIDLLGVNYYTVNRLAADPASKGHDEFPGCEGIAWLPPRGEPTEMNWEVIPQGLEDLLVRLWVEYPGVPLMITENGAAYPDSVDDRDRIAFLDGHFRAAANAIERGADLRGYLVWSLLDNFEWARGYHKRFGLVRVDYDTLERTPRSSAHWYREVIARNGLL